MLANTMVKVDNAINPVQCRRVQLLNILKKLAKLGSFNKCVLSDEKGMVISEFGEQTLNKDTVGAMFALIHNVITRSIKNLNLADLDVLFLQTQQQMVFTTLFRIDHYERSLILTAFSNSIKNPGRLNHIPEEPQTIKNSITTIISKPKSGISFLELFKMQIKSKVRHLLSLDKDVTVNNAFVDHELKLSLSKSDRRIKFLTESIKEFKAVL